MASWLKILQDQRLDRLFQEREIYARRVPLWQQWGLLIGFSAVFSLGARVLPANGFIGFDWVHFFGQGRIPPFYPPWTGLIVQPLTWPLLVGLTLGAVLVAILLRAVHPLSALFALLTLPLFWTVFIGQLDGLLLIGLTGLPWLAPLALIKPQVTLFAFGARRSYLASLFVVLGVSFLIWGLWPLSMTTPWESHAEVRYVNDIALGLYGLPLAIPLLWFSRGDIDMLMAAGTFMTPYLLPYNLLPLVPAIARLSPLGAAVAALLTWLPLSANWLGPLGWWLGWLFLIWLWFLLARARYRRLRFGTSLQANSHA